jgi:hypothetical protein
VRDENVNIILWCSLVILFSGLDVAAYSLVEPKKRRKLYFMLPGGGFAALILHGINKCILDR